MKSYVAVLAAVALAAAFPSGVEAQLVLADGSVRPDTLASHFLVDFAVPEGPAFDLLSVDPSSILRPGSVRDVALALSSFAGEGGLRLPDALGVEVSPALLIAGRSLSLAGYQARPWLYRFRISAAVERDADTGDLMRLGFGARVSLIDGSDLRTNEAYVTQATDIAERINEIQVAARLRAGPPPNPIVLTPEEIEQIEALNEKLKERWADREWNADVLDVAVAGLTEATAEGGAGLRATEWAAWATWGKGLGGWGQWLLGVKGFARRAADADEYDATATLSSRFYAGNQRYRVFVEGSRTLGAVVEAPDWFVNSGGEARLLPSLWATLAVGFEHGAPEQESTAARARLALTVGLPPLR